MVPVVVCSKDISDSLVKEAEALGAVEYVWSMKDGPREADILEAMEKATHRIAIESANAADAKRWEEARKLISEARKLAEDMSR